MAPTPHPAVPPEDIASPREGKVTVTLQGVTETLLIPIAARAWDATSPSPILGDNAAVQLMERLDYDFDPIRLSPSESASVAVRTLNFDRWVSSFLELHKSAVIVNLGCGLDSRAERLQWGKEASWVDVDLPQVADLRRRVMSTSFPGRDYKLLEADITTDGWLDGVPKDRPTAVVMEGLLSYLTTEDSRAVLKRLVDHFDEGELFLECINSTILKTLQGGRLKAVNKTGAQFQSAVDDLKDLENIKEDLKIVEAVRFVEAPGVEKLPMRTRFQMYVASWIPVARDGVRLVRMRFGSLET